MHVFQCLQIIFGYVIFDGHFSYFNYIGRLAFPIFAFQISQGYIYTKSLKRYLIRLGIFAVISQIPFMLFSSIPSIGFSLNIFFTLLLGLIAIICYDKLKNKFLGIILGIILGLIANYIKADYGFYGVSIIILFYIFKGNKLLIALSFGLATIIKYLFYIFKLGYDYRYIILILFTILSLIFILFYNGKKGKDTKYLLYIFYPVHLLVIYMIYFFLHI